MPNFLTENIFVLVTLSQNKYSVRNNACVDKEVLEFVTARTIMKILEGEKDPGLGNVNRNCT